MRRFSFGLLLSTIVALGACSVLNAPDPVKPGGTGGGGAGGSSSSGASSSSGMMACRVADDCKDLSDACSIGACINSMCAKQPDPAKEGMSCDDGLYCIENAKCVSGKCTGTAIACPPDPDACNTSFCDESAKKCAVKAVTDGQACDDGDVCTSGDSCLTGTCKSGPPTDCSNLTTECTEGMCVAGVGCQAMNVNENLPCDFDNVCATSACVTGTCTASAIFNGKACDDGLYCTDNDICDNAVCAGQPRVCLGATNCIDAVCDEANDSCGTVPVADGTSCDDGAACTIGTSCQGGTCTPTGTISACMTGDGCCPASCTVGDDYDCLYWKSGVQQNVPETALVGWSECWNGTYATSGVSIPNILSQCTKANLLMACRPVGQPNFSLLAMAPRADVLFDCGDVVTCTKQSNGVGFYFSNNRSWGFAPGGEPVNRNQCDFNLGGSQTLPHLRLCWHTVGQTINNGYRCGSNSLNGNGTWQRVLYHAD